MATCVSSDLRVTDPGARDDWGRHLSRMWEEMYSIPGCLGGAIWTAIDVDYKKISDEYSNYRDWGIIDEWRRTKPEYWYVKKAYSPIRILDKIISLSEAGQPIEIQVSNRHDFTNLSEVRIEWSIGNESGIIKSDIPPHSTGTISIQTKNTHLNGKSLSLKFYGPRGFLIDTYLLPIGKPVMALEIDERTPTGKVELIEDEKTIKVKGSNFQWDLDHKSGLIRNATINGQEVFIKGSLLMVVPLRDWRQQERPKPTSNDKKGDMYLDEACSNWETEAVTTSKTANYVEIQVKGHYKEADGTYSMRIDGSGLLTIYYRFTYNDEVNPRRIGIVFDMPKAFDTLRWKRKAQWTVYPDDHIGRPTGEAKVFSNVKEAESWTKPDWSWFLDNTPFGTNDFCATRQNILNFSLTDEDANGIFVQSDGTQHGRAYVEGEQIRLLVAFYYTGRGGPRWQEIRYKHEQMPLKKGAILEDSVRLKLISRD